MTMIAATIIAYDKGVPYFLVQENKGGYSFFSVKYHKHEEETSLGCILNAFAAVGIHNFDQWQIGELSAVKNSDGILMPLYSFEIQDWHAVANKLDDGLVFKSADDIKELLMTLEPSSFTAFEDI